MGSSRSQKGEPDSYLVKSGRLNRRDKYAKGKQGSPSKRRDGTGAAVPTDSKGRLREKYVRPRQDWSVSSYRELGSIDRMEPGEESSPTGQVQQADEG